MKRSGDIWRRHCDGIGLGLFLGDALFHATIGIKKAALIFGVLILMIVIEIRKQHPLHISYAALLLALITVLLYANSALLFGEVLIV